MGVHVDGVMHMYSRTAGIYGVRIKIISACLLSVLKMSVRRSYYNPMTLSGACMFVLEAGSRRGRGDLFVG